VCVSEVYGVYWEYIGSILTCVCVATRSEALLCLGESLHCKQGYYFKGRFIKNKGGHRKGGVVAYIL
jgi:hypothetical protein